MCGRSLCPWCLNCDAQFVVRLPDRWNGGLLVAGTPGNREQYANDRAIGDWVLARGYAFATTDKGNTGAAFYRDGRRPGDVVAEWNTRLTQLTRAAGTVVRSPSWRASSSAPRDRRPDAVGPRHALCGLVELRRVRRLRTRAGAGDRRRACRVPQDVPPLVRVQ